MYIYKYYHKSKSLLPSGIDTGNDSVRVMTLLINYSVRQENLLTLAQVKKEVRWGGSILQGPETKLIHSHGLETVPTGPHRKWTGE